MNDTQPNRLARGLQAIEHLDQPLGNPHGLLHGMRLQAPEFKQHFLEDFGDYFRPDQVVDEKTRTLLSLALACTAGTPPALLEFCAAAALKQGWQRKQVLSAVELSALFNGWPAAIAATQTVMATFSKLDNQAMEANKS
ncbi:carboxymuconolactone decarboxylase family protein [Erwinia aphidicola]|uniref:carboxymuconolactone decarboxylase family protein n=1 Tax=Erwinia aphidicola TaxID=68334 RepID=UPI00300C2FAA